MPYQITNECIACGVCEADCDSHAIEPGEDVFSIDGYKCTDCGNCEEICPVGAAISA